METRDAVSSCSDLNDINVYGIDFDHLRTLVHLCDPQQANAVNSTDVADWQKLLFECKDG